ncbi:hypothetical protein Rsub_00307 [Raphidocelis subcapitata]|uniref:WRKY domain-containing protein n=1 Tax=Raphidocelis subcapitata TaxID=307507 RepID=A0A2V0NK03_9CHLO|nr:hypothetical protein Rsub_00307 [Raphidocelis subcapitata]|eukprot:GBF87596.1 hypothetical protein Rsub_00307 [Raphidocelis subcapitata]
MEALVAAARRFIASSPLSSPAKSAGRLGEGDGKAADAAAGTPQQQPPQSPLLDVGVKWVVKPLPGPLQRGNIPTPAGKRAAPKQKPPPKKEPRQPPKKSTFGRTIKSTPAAAEAAAEAAAADAAAQARKSSKRSRSAPPPGVPPAKYRGPGGAPSPAYRGRGGSANDDGSFWRKYGEKPLGITANAVRGYFRCTEPRCPARKTVERDVETGEVLGVEYRGEHSHPPIAS